MPLKAITSTIMEEHPQARFIVETLSCHGFIAYYAGGWVRDYLLKSPSDDIDIATNAPPETIQALFPKTVPIGISFGIILVIVDGREYEVATFRSDLDYRDGRRPSRIEFTTAQEDAKRRDFTINGMFYDPLTNQIFDYVEGRLDLERKLIRAIGDPHQRIHEDRLRMLRAIRLSCRLHFHIDEATQDAIRAHASELLPAVAIERIVQELEKSLAFGNLHHMLIKLHEFGLLAAIFPSLKQLSLSDLEENLKPLEHFPKDAPLIAYLLQIIPDPNLAKQLKLPNFQHQFALFFMRAKNLSSEAELFEWAYLYASPFAETAILILAALTPFQKRPQFLEAHHERQHLLMRQIERIRNKDPLITAADLLEKGIPAGVEMGRLLRIAEHFAINNQIENKKIVLDYLFQGA